VANTNLIISLVGDAETTSNTLMYTEGVGILNNISVNDTFELQVIVETANDTDGFGPESKIVNDNTDNIYAYIVFHKI
jgi:hypothetical protein